jgi:hypothetical protein
VGQRIGIIDTDEFSGHIGRVLYPETIHFSVGMIDDSGFVRLGFSGTGVEEAWNGVSIMMNIVWEMESLGGSESGMLRHTTSSQYNILLLPKPNSL